MITISYQTFGNKGFQLRLRLYQSGETKFINVTKLLKGAIQKRHWNGKKQMFIPSCPFSEENNEMLVQFRQKYDKAAIDWDGSVAGMIASMQGTAEETKNGLTVVDFIRLIVEGLKSNKHEDGSIKGTYEGYEKLERRFVEFCKFKKIRSSRLLITELSPTLVDDMLDWVRTTRDNSGIIYISKMLRSVVSKADAAGHLKLEDFRHCKWQKKKRGSSQKTNTLTEEQCKLFAKMDLTKICSTRFNELYRDFCLFILYTGQSVCDAATLKYSDIKKINGISHFVFRRRKIAEKQAVPCAVPISQEMQRIMERWRHLSKDGYVFPIRTKAKIKTQTTNNGDIKRFICRLNVWLKKVGQELKVSFPLHTYTFRHTAITYYLSKGVPIIYVANMMGTSVDNCEKIYYNNHGDTQSRNKVLAAMSF